jgi:hypothetical protein
MDPLFPSKNPATIVIVAHSSRQGAKRTILPIKKSVGLRFIADAMIINPLIMKKTSTVKE